MTVINALVEHVPSWGYALLLLFSLLAAIGVTGLGFRVCGAALTRVRLRRSPSP